MWENILCQIRCSKFKFAYLVMQIADFSETLVFMYKNAWCLIRKLIYYLLRTGKLTEELRNNRKNKQTN
jgi:hypothetical protein